MARRSASFPVMRLILIAATALTGGGLLAVGWDRHTSAGLATDAGPGISDIETGSIDAALQSAPPHDTDAQLLRQALSAFETGDREMVRLSREALPEGTNARAALDWSLAMAHPHWLTTTELRRLERRFANWPGADTIAENVETAQLGGGNALTGVLQRLTGQLPGEPVTTGGIIARASQLMAQDETDAARDLIAPLWHTDVLSRSIERSIASSFEDVLTEQDHRIRYFNMMVRERISAGDRVADEAGMRPLHAAWATVIRNQPGAIRQIASIPDDLLETPAGIYMRVELARRAGEMEEAAALLDLLPEDPEDWINADAWWNEIRIVSRSLREAGDAETAYELVSKHEGGRPATQVDAAFHAGWYALRSLDDPETALPHFERILDIARGSASRSRAHYWIGRSHAAAGDDERAKAAFRQAAQFETTYHGQLALSALGEPLRMGQPVHDAVDMAAALRNEAVRAGLMLKEAGQDRLARQLLTGLGQSLHDPGVISALVERLNDDGDHFTALRVAKRAQWHGREIGVATHPVGALPLSDDMRRTDLALAYAIARQESEFRLDAVSHADARGLLQLLPSTASEVANRLELPYNAARLTTDAAYNTRLGTAYLAQQRNNFAGSYVLTFVAYNAGPGRARQWIERFGDPRGLPLEDVIDWVEQIPFPETRGYVQKVMENLQVYKARLDAGPDIARDLQSGHS